MKKAHPWLLSLVILLEIAIIVGAYYYFFNSKVNRAIDEESFSSGISDVYEAHYHSTEHHNGNLYLIRRTGGDLGYLDNPDWTDELWRYNEDKQGVKLYSGRGLDFRVAPDESLIAVLQTPEQGTPRIIFLNQEGAPIKIVATDELTPTANLSTLLTLLDWDQADFWLATGDTATIESLVKIDTDTFEVNRYDVSALPLHTGEFALNPNQRQLAYSNYPPLLDIESFEEFEARGEVVTLFVYDLVSQTERVIATSSARAFEPLWLDANTLEYNDPTSSGRITRALSN